MTRVLLIVALLATVFWVYSIVDCAVQPPDRHRGVSKPVWLVIVVLLPVLGGILWFTVGRMRAAALRAARNAPDDDPEFLSRLGSVSDQDERIRRLEEELAQLDAEDDSWTPPPLPGPTGSSTGEQAPPRPHDATTPPRPDDDDTRGSRGTVG